MIAPSVHTKRYVAKGKRVAVLGIIEIDSIARGINAMDAAVKATPADLLRGHPIDPGKYIIALAGEVASVQASVAAAITVAEPPHIVDAFTLPNAHASLLDALEGAQKKPKLNAVGIVETNGAGAIIRSTDAAVKAAPVEIANIHLALHIGGKGFSVLVGEVADVEASIAAAKEEAGDAIVHTVVIPNPYEETFAEILKRETAWKAESK